MKAQQGLIFVSDSGRYSLCKTEQGRWYFKALSNTPEEHILIEHSAAENLPEWSPTVRYICAIASLKLGCRVRPIKDFSQSDTPQQQAATEAQTSLYRELPLSTRKPGWYDRRYNV